MTLATSLILLAGCASAPAVMQTTGAATPRSSRAIHTQVHKGVRWHGGNQQGATSMIYWLPAEQIGIAVLTNLGAQGAELTALTDRIATIMMQRP